MRPRSLKILFFLQILYPSLFLSSCFSHREQPAPLAVLAEVNGTSIREDALRTRINMSQFQGNEEEGQTPKDPSVSLNVKKTILNRMVQNRAIIDWGTKKGIFLTDAEKAQGLEKLKSGYAEREFEFLLKEKNSTYAQWNELACENLAVQKILRESLYKNIKVTPNEVTAYYQKHKEKFMMEERVHVRQITTDTLKKAHILYQQVAHGENFAKIAIMHSISPDRKNGGDLGYFARGTHPKEFDDTCFSMEPGEISAIVKSPYGYHIFKMIEKKPKGYLAVEEALPRIESELLQKKLAESYVPWLDGILAQSAIKLNEKALEKME